MQLRRPEHSGFSALELLIVVAILLILTTMFWGFESRGSRASKMKFCQTNLRKIFIALDIYANDAGGSFPFVMGAATAEIALDPLTPKYTADTSSFICPSSRDDPDQSGNSLAAQSISYAYYMGVKRAAGRLPLLSDRQVNTLPKPVGAPVFSADGKKPANNHKNDGGNVLFSDGGAECSTPSAQFNLAPPAPVILLNPKL
jgi:prepilin-type N-terminal cleavage/methylation domain-containing protein